MKNCPNCNIEYSDKDSFCMECGKNLPRMEIKAPVIKLHLKVPTPKISELEKEPKEPRIKIREIKSKPIPITLRKGADKLEKEIQDINKKIESIKTDSYGTRIAALEKKKSELNKGINYILTYMKENEKAVEDIEKKLKDLNNKMKKTKSEKTAPRKLKIEKHIKTEKILASHIASVKNELKELRIKIRKIKSKPIPITLRKGATESEKYIVSNIKSLEKEIAALEKKKSGLNKGIKNILTYMKENEETVENIEKKLNDVIVKEDLKTHHKKVKFDTERLLNMEKAFKKLKSDISSLILEVSDLKNKRHAKRIEEAERKLSKEIPTLTRLEKRIDEQEEIITHLFHSNKKLKSVGLNKKTILENVKEQRLRKHLALQDKLIKKLLKGQKEKSDTLELRILKNLGKIKDESSREIGKLNKKLSRLGKNVIDVNAQASIDKEFEKFNQLRKEFRAATRVELKKIEDIRSSIQPTLEKEISAIEKFKEKTHSYIESVEETLENLDSRVAKEIEIASRKVNVLVAKEVSSKLHNFEEIKEDAENKLRIAKDLIKNIEKRLGTEIINLTQKVNTLSNIQKSQEMEILSVETPVKKMFEEAIKSEKANIMKEMENYIIENYSKEKDYLISHINELKSRIDEIEKSNREDMKKELIKAVLDEIESEMA